MKSETTPQEIAQATTIVKPVAIYCRVSTENQESEGTSLDTQRQACLKYCQEHNYKAIRQFAETTSGLTLDRPQLDELRELVRSEQISGVVIYCLDRLSRDPTHGVILQEELKTHHVTLEAVTENIESTKLGELITYIRQFAANLEAEKIRERTMRGTKARVFDRRLPVTYKQPFGYSWDKENKRLVPNSDYDAVKLIFSLATEGKSYDYIIAELKRRGISSPSGLPEWNKHTISVLIRNPVYVGRYHAFKYGVVEPKKRNGRTNGKSSVRQLPQDQWHYIPEIEVVNPPMTLDQRALLLEQIQQRQKLSKRHAKRDYLLRGMIFCETHLGKQGEPRRYHGRPYGDKCRYICPAVGKCDGKYLDGPRIEEYFKSLVNFIFGATESSFWRIITDEKNQKKTGDALQAELAKLEKEKNKLIDNLVKIEDNWLGGRYQDTEVYDRLKLKYQHQHDQVKARQETLLDQLAQLGRENEAFVSFMQLRERFLARLRVSLPSFKYWETICNAFDIVPPYTPEMVKAKEIVDKWQAEDKDYKPLSQSEWRELFTAVNLKIGIYPNKTKGKRSANFGLGKKMVSFDFGFMLPIDMTNKGMVHDIALHSPEACLHNKPTYYPLRFSFPNINTELTSILAGVKANE